MKSISQIATIVAALAPLTGVAGAAVAQGSSPFFFAPPQPSDPQDSAFSVELAESFRRLYWNVGRMRVVGNRNVCLQLARFDYPCAALLSDIDARRLAAEMRAGAYATGRLERDSAVTLHLRLHDRSRTGMSGRMRLEVAPTATPEVLANFLSRLMQRQATASEGARACYEARDRGEYGRARASVEQARYFYPNHPAAALCLATIFELRGDPTDSVIMAYKRALAGEPDQPRIETRLTRLLLSNGDSLQAAAMLTNKLRREPDDQVLQMRVASLWLALGHPDWAMTVLPLTVDLPEHGPSMTRLMARVCLANGQWICHLEALGALYAADSALVGDTIFYFQAIGAAQEAGEPQRVLTWVDEAIEHSDVSPTTLRSFRLARAAAWSDAGERDSSIAAYRFVLRDDPDDVRSLVAMAQLAVDERFLPIDSMVRLETAWLTTADSLLTVALALDGTAATREAAASIYFDTGNRLVQARVASHTAQRWLDRAVTLVPRGQTAGSARALRSLALFFLVQDADRQIRAERACDLVAEQAARIDLAQRLLSESDRALPELETRVSDGLAAYEAFVPEFRAAFQCAP